MRHKTFLFHLLLVSSAFYFLLSILSFSYAQEQLTITTYYPSPYGSYAELRSKRMAVGDTWIDAATYPWDDDGGNPEGNEIRENADLVVKGSVGIGTRDPMYPLHIAGGVGIESLYPAIIFHETDTAGSGSYWRQVLDAQHIRWDSSDNININPYNTRLLIEGPTGNVGIGTTGPTHPLHMGNGAFCNAAGQWQDASDIAYKKNIVDLKYSLKEIIKLQPREFDMKQDGSHQIGFIAQEIEKVIPEVVSGQEGQKGVSYGTITAVLVNAIKEQQREIEELKAEILRLNKSR